jgi:hypothetical protein
MLMTALSNHLSLVKPRLTSALGQKEKSRLW